MCIGLLTYLEIRGSHIIQCWHSTARNFLVSSSVGQGRIIPNYLLALVVRAIIGMPASLTWPSPSTSSFFTSLLASIDTCKHLSSFDLYPRNTRPRLSVAVRSSESPSSWFQRVVLCDFAPHALFRSWGGTLLSRRRGEIGEGV